MQDPLEILGIQKGSSLQDAKASYKKLCVKYHPDKNPGDISCSEKFKEIVEAYKTIEQDPSILNLEDIDEGYGGDLLYLRASIDVSLKDFYFCAEKMVRVKRRVYCRKCSGTGSDLGINDTCSHCGGTGKIKSNVLDLLNMKDTCPICKGSGHTSGKKCSCCKGSKYIYEVITIPVRVNIYYYYKKVIKVKNQGHQISQGRYSDVYVTLNILGDLKVKIEDNYFCMTIGILPIQRIIGDTSFIDIFGRTLKYTIQPGSYDTYITDNITKKFSRTVRLKFIEKEIKPTSETLPLYKKILEIEKRESD